MKLFYILGLLGFLSIIYPHSTHAAIGVTIMNIPVTDQQKAKEFYTKTLDFKLKSNIPMGNAIWLTVVGENAPNGTELFLEMCLDPDVKRYQKAMFDKKMPVALFEVDNAREEYKRLKATGVKFLQEPKVEGNVVTFVLDDTVGNYIKLYEKMDKKK